MYRKIRSRELFIAAYAKLYANQGALTPGVDPEDTVDGMSLDRIDRIIHQLGQGTYRWKPSRRVYVKKRNGKLRALGLPGWNDKLLQEVIRMLLEAYYEPQFSSHSHGFRPGRGCHTALDEIRRQWKGVKWFIEGDIQGCFDNLAHDLILDLIGRSMPDQRFLKLLKEMLKAGYVQDWQYHQTYSGAPQGGIISPVISNIVLNEFDKYIENELLPVYNRGDVREVNPVYRTLSKEMDKAKAARDIKRYRELRKERRKTPSVRTDDDAFRRLHYIRYGDDVRRR
jgi:group II intron reverse transcriptase/maturase